MEVDGELSFPPPLQLEHLTQRQVSMKFLHAAAFAVVLTHWSDQDDVYIVLIVDGYYLVNIRHPEIRLRLILVD